MTSSSEVYNPGNYPRTYVTSTEQKVIAILTALVLAVVGVVGLWHLLPALMDDNIVIKSRPQDIQKQLFHALGCLIALLGSLFVGLSTFYYQIVLHPDRIEVQNLFGSKTLARERIANWQIRTIKSRRIVKLTSTDSRANPLTFTLEFEADAAFSAWFAELPLHDDMLDQIENISTRTPMTDEPKLAIVNMLLILGFVSYIILVYMRPYPLLTWLMLALPWVAIAAAWMGKGMLISSHKESTQAKKMNLAACILIPAQALLFDFAHRDTYLLNWQDTIMPILVMAMPMFILILLNNHRRGEKLFQSLPYVIVSIFYATAAVTITNESIDYNAPTCFHASIVDRHETHGKGAKSYFTLSAWGSHYASYDEVVNREYYRSKAVGDTVCIDLHTGFYHIPWYTIGDCAQTSKSL